MRAIIRGITAPIFALLVLWLRRSFGVTPAIANHLNDDNRGLVVVAGRRRRPASLHLQA
jgi:hypothetical protein